MLALKLSETQTNNQNETIRMDISSRQETKHNMGDTWQMLDKETHSQQSLNKVVKA